MGNMERRFGRFALKNLTLYLIIFYVFGYIMELVNAQFVYDWLILDPYWIMKGQVWRVITWLLVPPDASNMFFVVIMCFFYYSIGNQLEQTWGTFYYNVFILSGILFTVIGSFVLYGILDYQMDWQMTESLDLYYRSSARNIPLGQYASVAKALQNEILFTFFSTYYINMSIFLGFAATFPDAQVLLMFIIPIKVKWLGVVYAAMILFDVFSARVSVGGVVLDARLPLIVVAASSLLNFIIFFIFTRKRIRQGVNRRMRQRAQKQYATRMQERPKVSKHRCAVCGRTNDDDSSLEFRFCSKCNGNYEYCMDHLYTHTHVQ